jgi:outer membrane scaffolding protein for murein synthesis (MipA/OmpV family)
MRPRSLLLIALLAWACVPGSARSQTPSPLQDWQYSSGIPLEKLFQPNLPKWQVILGVSAATEPVYPGSKSYHPLGGPVFDIRYKDIAFASTGEGIGVNLLRGMKYRLGVALGIDLGRHVADDYPKLHGLNDIGNSPVAQVFGSYVLSKKFPLVLRADMRRYMGGVGGITGDLEGYLPLPGSSQHLVMFAGPSITFADRSHLRNLFGITPSQSLESGLPPFSPHGGTNSWGIGFSATGIISSHWLFNTQAAYSRLMGSAQESPITHSAAQGMLALSMEYRF